MKESRLEREFSKVGCISAKLPSDSPLDMDKVSVNVQHLLDELDWLVQILKFRYQVIEQDSKDSIDKITPPDFHAEESAYSNIIRQHQLSVPERLLFITALAPYISPALFTNLLRDPVHSLKVTRPEFGGFIKSTSRQFVPTMQTFLFLLSGNDQENATKFDLHIRESSKLFAEGIIREHYLEPGSEPSNPYDSVLTVTPEYVDHIKSGRVPEPDFGPSFPATRITTQHNWSDLVVNSTVRQKLNEMISWESQRKSMKEESYRFDLPFVCLFHGAPGTGKTMATKLIGKTLNKQVYRIDLSMVVSKYIGETEKNLAYIFDRSENQDWILFFDEADALFTKRTSVSSSNDKWANLEISYLLQRLEEFTGIAILATNLFANIDTAMRRRFKYIIEFTRPGMMERRKLWQNALPSSFRYSEEIDLDLICREELTGANVGNIIHKSRIKMGQDHKNEVSKSVLYEAIKEELNNENRTPSYIPISH